MDSRIAHKPGEFSHGQINDFVVSFGKRGGSPSLLQWLIERPDAMMNLIQYTKLGCQNIPKSEWYPTYRLSEKGELAKKILADDFITPIEVMDVCGSAYSNEQMEHLNDSLPSESILVWLHTHNYLLIAGPPHNLTLHNILDLDDQNLFSDKNDWYKACKQKFAWFDFVKSGKWLAIQKGGVAASERKNWSEQQKLISGSQYIPNAAEVCFATVIYQKIRCINLLQNLCVRTSSEDAQRLHVFVGNFGDDVVGIYEGLEGARYHNLFLASACRL